MRCSLPSHGYCHFGTRDVRKLTTTRDWQLFIKKLSRKRSDLSSSTPNMQKLNYRSPILSEILFVSGYRCFSPWFHLEPHLLSCIVSAYSELFFCVPVYFVCAATK